MSAGLADALRTSTAFVGSAGDRRTVLRDVADDIAGLSAGLQVLGPQIASASKSARCAIVRRSTMRATPALEPTRRPARNLEIFAAELLTFSGWTSSTGWSSRWERP